MENKINMKNIRVVYSKNTLVYERDLEFKEGNSYLVRGASGCGKTTLLNVINEKINYEGELKVNGKLSYLQQSPELLELFTVADNISAVKTSWDKQQVQELLSQFEIDHLLKKKVSKLSGGERQRVALVQMVIKDADILILDEPTSAMNTVLAKHVMSSVINIGKTTIVVSHDMALAELFDEVIDLEEVIKHV